LNQDDSEGLVEGLKALIETIVHENVSLVISRQILSEISCHVPKLTDDMGKSVCSFALGKIQPRVISFEEQVASIRQHLADIFEREQCWKEAANVLVGIPLETGQK
jgi:COP9 signalosome complex subunit 4